MLWSVLATLTRPTVAVGDVARWAIGATPRRQCSSSSSRGLSASGCAAEQPLRLAQHDGGGLACDEGHDALQQAGPPPVGNSQMRRVWFRTCYGRIRVQPAAPRLAPHLRVAQVVAVVDRRVTGPDATRTAEVRDT